MQRLNIQRILLVVVLCLSILLATAGIPGVTTVTCNVPNYSGSAVALYKVENGEAKSMGFRQPGKQDTIQFSFSLEKEGFYFIQRAGSKGGMYNHVIYLKPGDNKLVDIHSSQLSIDFDCKVVKPDYETVYLQNWIDRMNTMYKLGTNRTSRDEFINEYGKLVKEAEGLKKASKSNSKYFNYVFNSKVDADMLYLKVAAYFNFGNRLNAGYDSTEKNRQFYQSIAGQKFCDADILHSELGLELVKFSLGYNLLKKYGSEQQMQGASFAEKANAICSDAVRTAYVADHMDQITNYERFKTDIQPYKKLFATTALKQIYQKKEDELTVYAKGATAYNFSLFDTKDHPVSLSDFKGKVVVMDIWAMWCAPCLTEKPFFQKVEAAFEHRDDIVFIGLSHDGLVKKELWKKFVEKKGWKNIEMLANYNEGVGKYYKIDGIPRFMIFDKEGKIVTVDAPRPSNPAFKKLIEETLASIK